MQDSSRLSSTQHSLPILPPPALYHLFVTAALGDVGLRLPQVNHCDDHDDADGQCFIAPSWHAGYSLCDSCRRTANPYNTHFTDE